MHRHRTACLWLASHGGVITNGGISNSVNNKLGTRLQQSLYTKYQFPY